MSEMNNPKSQIDYILIDNKWKNCLRKIVEKWLSLLKFCECPTRSLYVKSKT